MQRAILVLVGLLAPLVLGAQPPEPPPLPSSAAVAPQLPPVREGAPGPRQSQQAAQLAQQAAAVEESPDWAVTLERIASSVVSIEVDAVRAFDTEWNTSARTAIFSAHTLRTERSAVGIPR